jgi:hypothetical protein
MAGNHQEEFLISQLTVNLTRRGGNLICGSIRTGSVIVSVYVSFCLNTIRGCLEAGIGESN